ncbi:hypothetical protein C8R43DRAFT_1034502 [Mycena crocata]|nr:hypothetical protein C8R43DRAFT_1034502 [Mycena crocata]
MCGGVGITFPSIRTGISASRHTLSPAHHSRLVSPRLAPPLPPMPSLPAIPPSPPRRPLSFTSFLVCILAHSSTQALHYGTPGRTRNRRKNLALVHNRTRRRTLHTVDIHCVPPSRDANAERKSLPFHSTSPSALRLLILASSTDMNAHRHQPRQPAQTPPASSLHLRPRVQSRLTSIRDVAVHTCAESMEGNTPACARHALLPKVCRC